MSKYTVLVNVYKSEGKPEERTEVLFESKWAARNQEKYNSENYGFAGGYSGNSNIFYTVDAQYSKNFKNPSMALCGYEHKVTTYKEVA